MSITSRWESESALVWNPTPVGRPLGQRRVEFDIRSKNVRTTKVIFISRQHRNVFLSSLRLERPPLTTRKKEEEGNR